MGGDVLKFWSEYHKKNFAESVQDLARKYSIPIDYNPEAQIKEKRNSLQFQMHELAAQYYLDKLLASSEAQHCRDYLNSRAISTESIHKFRLGYSPKDKNDWSKLCKLLKDKFKCSDEEILEAGLASRSDKDPSKPVYYDRFRGRLMIAITDERGRVIAFGARALLNPDTATEPSPKYLNSPDSEIYHKGEHLFGLNLAKEAIHKENAAIVTEGYFDTISLHQAGIFNVVANLGTALTLKQARLLCKFSDSKRIYLCFDTDKAGEDATERAIETIVEASSGTEAEIRILRVLQGKDPDELIRQEGSEAFRALIQEAPLILDYQIDKILNGMSNASPKAKSQALSKLSKYIRHIKNKIEEAEYVRIIANRLGLNDEAALREQLNIELNRNPYQAIDTKTAPRKSATRLPNSLKACEQELLVLCIYSRDLIQKFLKTELTLISPEHQSILDAIVDLSFENPSLEDIDSKFQELQQRLSSRPELSSYLSDLGMSLDLEKLKASPELRFQGTLLRLKKEKLKLELEDINSKIKELSSNSSTNTNEEWNELDLAKKRIKLELERCR